MAVKKKKKPTAKAVEKAQEVLASAPKKRGRKKGVPNKLTTDVRKAIDKAFRNVGGFAYLEALAESDPRTFCGLLAKLVPQSREEDAGEKGATTIRLITRVPASPEQPGVLRLVNDTL